MAGGGRRELVEGWRRDPTSSLLAHLRRGRLTAPLLDGSRMVQAPLGLLSLHYFMKRAVGPGWVSAGAGPWRDVGLGLVEGRLALGGGRRPLAVDVVREGAKGAAVIDVTSILVGDVPAGFALDLMRHFHMRSVDPKRSYVDTVKVSPGSVDIRFYQTWVADPAELHKPIADGEEERRDRLMKTPRERQP
jgi:hypothetical protein